VAVHEYDEQKKILHQKRQVQLMFLGRPEGFVMLLASAISGRG